MQIWWEIISLCPCRRIPQASQHLLLPTPMSKHLLLPPRKKNHPRKKSNDDISSWMTIQKHQQKGTYATIYRVTLYIWVLCKCTNPQFSRMRVFVKKAVERQSRTLVVYDYLWVFQAKSSHESNFHDQRHPEIEVALQRRFRERTQYPDLIAGHSIIAGDHTLENQEIQRDRGNGRDARKFPAR